MSVRRTVSDTIIVCEMNQTRAAVAATTATTHLNVIKCIGVVLNSFRAKPSPTLSFVSNQIIKQTKEDTLMHRAVRR